MEPQPNLGVSCYEGGGGWHHIERYFEDYSEDVSILGSSYFGKTRIIIYWGLNWGPPIWGNKDQVFLGFLGNSHAYLSHVREACLRLASPFELEILNRVFIGDYITVVV